MQISSLFRPDFGLPSARLSHLRLAGRHDE
jgi:hypothetical protein